MAAGLALKAGLERAEAPRRQAVMVFREPEPDMPRLLVAPRSASKMSCYGNPRVKTSRAGRSVRSMSR